VHLAAVHVAAFGGDVHQLVHGEHEEVHPDVHMDRPQPGQGHSDRSPGHGILRQWSSEHSLRTELMEEALGRALDRLRIVHIQSEDNNRVIASHLLLGGFPDGVRVLQSALHVSFP